MVKIYIAGPITASSPWKMTLNIRRAEKVLIQLLREGFAPFCPHTMTAYLDGAAPREAFLETDLVWLKLCDAAIFLKGWEESKGSVIEHKFCRQYSIPCFYSVESVKEWYDDRPEG